MDKLSKFLIVFFALGLALGTVSAQDSDSAEFALSEQVTDYQTTEGNYFYVSSPAFENATNVTIDFQNDGNQVDSPANPFTEQEVLEENGQYYVNLAHNGDMHNVTIDQVEVTANGIDNTQIDEVTHHYDLDSSVEPSIDAFTNTQTFSDFTYFDSNGDEVGSLQQGLPFAQSEEVSPYQLDAADSGGDYLANQTMITSPDFTVDDDVNVTYYNNGQIVHETSYPTYSPDGIVGTDDVGIAGNLDSEVLSKDIDQIGLELSETSEKEISQVTQYYRNNYYRNDYPDSTALDTSIYDETVTYSDFTYFDSEENEVEVTPEIDNYIPGQVADFDLTVSDTVTPDEQHSDGDITEMYYKDVVLEGDLTTGNESDATVIDESSWTKLDYPDSNGSEQVDVSQTVDFNVQRYEDNDYTAVVSLAKVEGVDSQLDGNWEYNETEVDRSTYTWTVTTADQPEGPLTQLGNFLGSIIESVVDALFTEVESSPIGVPSVDSPPSGPSQ